MDYRIIQENPDFVPKGGAKTQRKGRSKIEWRKHNMTKIPLMKVRILLENVKMQLSSVSTL